MSTPQKTSLLKRQLTLADLRPLLPALALLLLAFAAYGPAISNEFIWDDRDYLVDCNPLKTVRGLYDIWFVPSATQHYFPVLFSFWWVEYRIWGPNLYAFHAANIVYHALAAGLLWHILRRLNVRGAWIAAALWAVHPMQVESVAWLTERKNILGAFFFFLAILCYLHIPATGRRRQIAWYVGVILCSAAAILSKQVMAVLPVVLILVDCWRDQRLNLARLKLTLPLLIPAALVAWTGIHQERHWVGTLGAEFNFSWPERFAIAGHSLFFYVQKFLFPWPLLTVYPRFNLQTIIPSGITIFALAIIIMLALLRLRRHISIGPWVLAAAFFVILLPALGFISFYTQLYTFVADHYAYLAIAALAIGVVATLARFLPQRALHIVAGFLLAACVIYSCNLSFLYRSHLALWRHTAQYNSSSWIVLNNTAGLLAKDIHTRNPDAPISEYREAIELYQRAAAISADWRTYDGLGFLYLQLGQIPEAVDAYQKMEAQMPDDVRRIDAKRGIYRDSYQYKVASYYQNLGRMEEAITWFRQAAEARPNEAASWAQLGNCLVATRQFDAALTAYTRVVELAPQNAEYLLRRGLVLRELGRNQEGMNDMLKARDLDPNVIERVMNPPRK